MQAVIVHFTITETHRHVCLIVMIVSIIRITGSCTMGINLMWEQISHARFKRHAIHALLRGAVGIIMGYAMEGAQFKSHTLRRLLSIKSLMRPVNARMIKTCALKICLNKLKKNSDIPQLNKNSDFTQMKIIWKWFQEVTFAIMSLTKEDYKFHTKIHKKTWLWF